MNELTPEALFESHLELALKIGRSFPIPNAAIDESEQEASGCIYINIALP